MPNGVQCQQCEFWQSSSCLNNLQGEGPSGGVMFVGQHPGRSEEMLLRPLVGETGHLLGDLLAEAGLTRSQIRVENAIRCRPLPGKEPAAKQIQACRPHLINAIRENKPKIVVVMGAVALQSVLGQTGISDLRGRFFTVDRIGDEPLGFEITVYCMLMPAVLFRRWEDYPTVVEDFKKLGRVIRGEQTEEGLGDYKVLKTVEEVDQVIDYLMEQPRVAFDLETTAFDFWDFSVNPGCNILCISLSAYAGTGFVIPFLQQHGKPFWIAEDWTKMASKLNFFLSSNVPKWAQNGIFDINFLRKNGFNFNLNSFTFDTMLAHHTLQENTPHGLDFLCGLYTSMPLYSYALKEWQRENGAIKTYADFPDELLWKYAGADADATIRIGDILLQQLQTELTEVNRGGVPEPVPLFQFFNELVMPLNRALIDMEYRGVVLDVDFLQELHKKEIAKEEEVTYKIYEEAGREINLRSFQQLQGLLFNSKSPPEDPAWDGKGCNGKSYLPGLGLPILQRTKAGKPSTAVETLEELTRVTKHPVLKLMMRLRKSQKMISTYLAGKDGDTGLLRFRIPETGRVHPDWKQHSVVTGRLSTSDPALHNIPRPSKDPDYAKIRLVFTVPDGWWLIQADYSQLELRIVATIAQEKTMLDAFAAGKDVHKWVASEINRIPYDQVTEAQRGGAKDIGFGIIYGKGAYSLAQDLSISMEEAQSFLSDYFERFPGLARYFDKAKGALHSRGVFTNCFGRKRRLYGYQFLDERRLKRYSSDGGFLKSATMKRAEMERQVVNFGVQSAGSDNLSRATAKVHQALLKRKMQSALIISHHDALYTETPEEELCETAWIVVSTMEAPVSELGNTSFPVDFSVGKRWGEADEEKTKFVTRYIQGKKEEMCDLNN